MSWYLWLTMILGCLGQLSDCITTQVGLAKGAKEVNPLFGWMTTYPVLMYFAKLSIPILFTVPPYFFLGDDPLGCISPGLFALIGFYAGVKNYMVIKGMTQ